jgi:hypothetical protein
MFQRIDQRGELDAFTKVWRAMGEQRTFRDIDGSTSKTPKITAAVCITPPLGIVLVCFN